MMLGNYGLAAFGISESDVNDVNEKLIGVVIKFYKDQEKGFLNLKVVLKEPYQKAEAITDGRSSGFHMFTGIRITKDEIQFTTDIFNILQESGWHYNLLLKDNKLVKK